MISRVQAAGKDRAPHRLQAVPCTHSASYPKPRLRTRPQRMVSQPTFVALTFVLAYSIMGAVMVLMYVI